MRRWKHRRNRFQVIIYCVLCAAQYHCEKTDDRSLKTRTASDSKFIYSMVSDIETLDPLQILYRTDWQIASFIYEGLIGYAENSIEISPLLARSWEIAENGKRYTFHLNTRVKFQNNPCFMNGKERILNAGDVVYTFQRILDNADKTPGSSLLTGKIKSMSVIDDSTVTFELNASYAAFLKILASPLCYIVPKEAVDFYDKEFSHHPVGTGPFQINRWNPFQSINLIRHEGYWRKSSVGETLPRLHEIQINIVSNMNKPFTEFLKGANMLLHITDSMTRESLSALSHENKVTRFDAPLGLTLRFLSFSFDNQSVFARHAELRTAIALSYNRSRLIPASPDAENEIAYTLVPPAFLNSRILDWYPFNPGLAEQLVKSANIRTEKAVCQILSNTDSRDIHVLLDGMQQIGISGNIKIQKTRYFQSIRNDRPCLFRVSFIPDFPDPEAYYSLFYSKSSREINLSGYRNPEYDDHFEKARIEQDAQERQNHFMAMETLLKQDVPLIYISHSKPDTYLVPDRVKGFKTRFLLFDLSEVQLDPFL